MIKKTLFPCICLVLASFFSAFAQTVYFLQDEDAGFGTPLSLAKLNALASGGESAAAPLFITEYQGASFDSLSRAKLLSFKGGRADSENVFASDGSLLYAVSFGYSEAGLLSEISAADASGAPKWAYRYEYDGEGGLLREMSLSFVDGQERLEGEIVSTYSGDGLLSKRETFSAEGALTLRESFSYDESGRLSEKNSYYGDGVLLKREAFEYASGEEGGDAPAGAVIRIRQYDSNGLYETSIFEYKDGRVSAVLRYGADSVLKDSEAFYYSEERILRRARFNANGSLVSETTRLYDWAGNLVMERSGSSLTVWEFAYPEQGFGEIR